ncbi:sensor histidine kinase [Anaerovorax sp. IOR16]|uniref:sensor histidine kinase n=1 Tax=Anaerovorax sp. IOR16 TaxID=2773458 RepID=UPI0019D107A5|nr:HAMP domain-containing sensor histidine kinase [Anaerovorax sp. IOR16]
MNFFWKIFFTTMFVSITCFSMGGYFLVNSNMNALIKNEANIAYELGDMVYYSLNNELRFMDQYYFTGELDSEVFDFISNISESINIKNSNGKILFTVISDDIGILFSSLDKQFDKNLLNSMSEDEKGYTLKKTKEGIYLQALRPAVFLGYDYHIETVRNVSYIFETQREQYQLLVKIILGMLLLAGIITFLLSKILIKPIVSLSKVTKEISAGKLEKRVIISGEDEFALLSSNFNKMADDLEEKIHLLEDEAEKKEMFVGAFSHELKTPLTSIIGYSDMLRRKEMDKDRIHLCANYIYTEGKRLEMLSMRLLEFIVVKNQEIYPVDISIKTFFDEIFAVVENQLSQSDIYLQTEIEDVILSFEPELMKTVFLNIIDNARKAFDHSGTIFVQGKVEEQQYKVKIIDNGKGMEEEELLKIKDAFYMVDKSRARKQGGAGLGLALCDQILKMHGFTIDFDSKLNEGTTVTITMKGHAYEK